VRRHERHCGRARQSARDAPRRPLRAGRIPQARGNLRGLKAGQIDMTIANATPARPDEFAWSPPLMLIELGFLVPAGSPLAAFANVDRPGVRVGVTQGGTMNSALARELKNAAVVPAATLKNGSR